MRRLLAVLTLVSSPAPLGAQLTPSQTLDRRRLDGLVTSPDGRVAAFVVTEAVSGTDRPRHVYLYRAGAAEPEQFTRSEKSEWSPRFSPDGKQLAFLSNRGERTGIWLMSLDGGEARQVATRKIAVERFEWSPDGRSIGFLGAPAKSEGEEAKLKDKDDARVVDRDSLTALWTVAVESGAVTRLTRPPWQIASFAWFPAGNRLALVATDSAGTDRWTERVLAIGTRDTVPTPLLAPKGPIGQLWALPNGVVFDAARVDGPTPHDLWSVGPNGGPARNLTGASVDRPFRSVEWLPDGRALVVVDRGFDAKLAWLGADGRATPGPEVPVQPDQAAPFADGALLLIGETTTRPPELWLVPKGGAPRPVSTLNAKAAALGAVTPERFHYRSFDGTEIEAALLLPPGRRAGERIPLVVVVHGGPTGSWSDRYESWGQLLVSRGYGVLYPNLRGSIGYGWQFLISNRADWGGGDFKDLMVGVDSIIGRGIADPAKIGIAGWSYGGYMASWAVTQTTRFKAAVTGAGMSDLAIEYGTERGPQYDEWFYGTPYEKPEGFRRSSPLTYVNRVRTPTLILQGEEDITDPISQSQLLHRALKRVGAPTELVLYPREGHGIREEKHLIDRLGRIADWFDRWMRPSGAAPRAR